jgi:uncharacterized protein YdcH (DUF465 family)
MSDLSEVVRKRLAAEDEDFRRWMNEHREHESRLAILAGKRTLSTEEELEEKELKKRKLHLKDLMADRARQYENTHSA